MDATLAGRLARGEVVALDGGLATTLAGRGHDLSGALWSARLLVDDPGALRSVHAAFLEAGADVVTAASYQVASRSLANAGLDPGDTDLLLARSVLLAREAAALHRTDAGYRGLVAASVGPYGAVLGSGAEYRGGYGIGVDELRRFHAPRIDALLEAGPDVLACETLPSGDEVRAIADLLDGLGSPAWVSLTVAADGTTTPEGQPLLDAIGPLLGVDEVLAVGVNCCDPAAATRALDILGVTGLPLVSYPNVTARWDETSGSWVRRDGPAPNLDGWVAAGARLVGGCCGTAPEDLTRLLAGVARHHP